ncbi:MAG: MFS transporter [Legionellaceae bacterium]|jgi:MFS family permease|nr:MFS transporter [Legionellaceae bacterium]
MGKALKNILSPLLSLFIFALCSGFFLTFLSLSMNAHDESPLMIGAMTGIFYAGLVCGSFKIEPFITRVGHIRAFSTFASLLAVISLLHGIFYNMPLWFVLRFITGFGTAGIFVVIESWFLCGTTASVRGRMLSLYMITFYAAEALGQLLINLGTSNTLLLYSLAAMLCSLSVIPLSMTRTSTPEFTEASSMSLVTLCKQTTSSVFGCFFAGMILSATYALLPILCTEIYDNRSHVSVFMFCFIMGGMLLQYPVGQCSDRIDRRLTVIIVCLFAVICSVLLMYYIKSYYISLLLITCFGGFATTIYPVCISYACDTLDTKNIVAGIQSLLLSYSIGSMLGPFIAPLFMHNLNETYIFIYFILMFGLTAVLFAWRKTQKQSPPQEEPFQVMRHTTPVLAHIDPRAE